MKNTLIAISLALLASGCDNNSNRAKDYKICTDAGMGTKVVGGHSIICTPPPFQCK